MRIIPSVRVQTPTSVETSDVYSALLNKGRIIMLDDEVTNETASLINTQLLFLSGIDPEAPITMYINTPGGSINAGLAIYDTMNFIPNPIQTVACGTAASMGSFLLSSGTKGMRYALPNSTIMLHQPQVGLPQDNLHSHQKTIERIVREENRLYKIYAENTDRTSDEIYEFCSEDQYLTAQEAKDYGLVDHVIVSQNELNSIS